MRISNKSFSEHFSLGPVFALVCCVVGLIYFGLMLMHVDLTGDEIFYFSRAHAISSWLWSRSLSPDLISEGFYMPGTSILLSPSQFVSESKWAARIWMFTLNCSALWLTVVLLIRIVSRKVAVAYAIAMAINPFNTFYAFTLWGDLIAAQLVNISILFLVASTSRPGVVDLRKVCWAGVAALAAVYTRSNFIVVFPLLAAGLIWSYLYGLNSMSNPLKSSAPYIAGVSLIFTFLLGLAPWSITISERFDTPILTTTSLDLAIIGNYADDQFISGLEPLHKHPGMNLYKNMVLRSNTLDMSVVSYMRQERERVMATVSFQEKLLKFTKSITKVYEEAGYVLFRGCKKFVINHTSKIKDASCNLTLIVLPFFTTIFYLGAGAFLMLTLGRDSQTRLLVLMVKGLLISFLALNLVHWGSGRYIHNFLPGMTLASVLFISQFKSTGGLNVASLQPSIRFIFYALNLFAAICAFAIGVILIA